ncbi:MAG: hypothetical protein H0W82_00635 [Actinobacteria bacterium]|nr:hypothetical protein [Actinomycetota bacterium]
MPTTRPRPTSLPRRFERWMMGVVLGVGAFFIEKLVMRSIRRGGGTTKPVESTPMQSKGTRVEG